MELSQDQRALRDAVRGLLARHQGDDDSVPWRRLCGEIGVAGLAIPERYGGAGAARSRSTSSWKNSAAASLRPPCWAPPCWPPGPC